MAESVGDLFVRIRPAPGSTQAFQSEASAGIKRSGSELGKVFAAAFIATSAVGIVSGVVKAATEHQAAFAVLDQTLKNAGVSNELYGKSVEALLEKEARLKGFSDEDLASAFQRIVAVTHDSARAYADLGKAEDLARFRHIELGSAALALSKLEQGSATSLQRLGIVLPQVTTAQDALTLGHQRAVAAGAKLTESQKEVYDQALANAKAIDKQATTTAGLALIQDRAGGSAATYADTAAGKFARAQQNFHQFEVEVGTRVIPVLTDAFNHLTLIGHSLEGLAAVAVGAKLLGWLNGVTAAVKVEGTEAEIATAQNRALGRSLAGLATFGIITLGVELLVNKQSVEKGVGDFLDRHGLGFLGGTKENEVTIPFLIKAAEAPGAAGIYKNALAKLEREAAEGNKHIAAELFKAGIISAITEAQASSEAAEKAAGGEAAAAFGGGFTATLADQITGGIQAAFTFAQSIGQQAKEQLAKDAQLNPLRQNIADDQASLADLRQQASDAAVQGAQALSDAINSAKQNLNSIGQSIASTLSQFIDKPLNDAAQKIQDAQAKLSLQGSQQSLNTLRQEILLPGGRQLSADPQVALRQLLAFQAKTKESPALDQFIQSYQSAMLQVESGKLAIRQSAAAHVKDAATQRIADLTDLLNTGRISLATFDKDITKLLKGSHLTYATALREFGPAFADTFQGQLTGLKEQAAVNAGGPHAAGSGLVPSITRPIDTLTATTKQEAGIAKQQRAAQAGLTKDTNSLLKKIHANQVAAGFTDSLSHNPGAASKRGKNLTGVKGG